MAVYRWNGEYWYKDRRSWWKRLRQWVIWVGGWERANGAGWRIDHRDPTPVSILGHRLTWYGHWADARTPWGRLVVNWRDGYAYISSDGTPSDAHIWLYGAPAEIVREAVRQEMRH